MLKDTKMLVCDFKAKLKTDVQYIALVCVCHYRHIKHLALVTYYFFMATFSSAFLANVLKHICFAYIALF